MVHRDVKPGNVLIGRRGEVKIADFGLAKPGGEDLCLTGSHVGLGTLPYVAPEQARGAKHVDHRSDMYALGGVLYELLTGTLPFRGENPIDVVLAKDVGEFPPASRIAPGVPAGCDRVLARLLAPAPEDRYPDYGGLVADLEDLVPAGARPDPAALAGAGGSTAEFVALAPPLRVLLIYDEAEYIPLTQGALQAAGVPHELDLAEDGRDALARVRPPDAGEELRRPDVVLLGLTHPTRDSLRALALVRASPALRGAPICALSTRPAAADFLRGLGLGVSLWVTGFGDLGPLAAVLRSTYDRVAAGPETPG